MLKGSAIDLLQRLVNPRSKETAAERFIEAFGHGSMSVGLYAPRGSDAQTPHTRDEVYFVLSGTGEFVHGGERCRFAAGDALFGAAGVEHRFENFSDDLAAWVIFYGPEGGESP